MNARIVLFVSIALLVGVGGGFSLGQALAPTPQSARAPLPGDNAGDLPDDPLTVPERRPERAPVRPESHPAEPISHPDPAPAPVLSGAPRIPVPLGDGVITGAFTDQNDAAVSGITALLYLDTSELWPQAPRREDFGDDTEAFFNAMMTYHEQTTRLRIDATMTAQSDGNGRFQFSHVPEGTSRVVVRPVGYLIEGGQVSITRPAKPGDHVEIKLIRALPVRVLVEAPEGDPPRNTRLSWTPNGEKGAAGGERVETGKETTVHLVSGSYRLKASFDGAGGGSVDLELGDTAPAELIVISSKPTRGLVGVVNFDGARPQYYFIQVVQVVPGLTDAELFSGRQGIHSAQAALNHATGKFSWEQSQDGEYAVGLKINNKLADSRKLWLGGAVREIAFNTTRPSAPSVKVTVRAPASENPRTPNLGCLELPGNRGMAQETWVISDSEFLIFFTAENRPLPQRAMLNVNMHQLGQISREFSPGVETDILVEFAEPAQLTVNIEGAPLGLRQLRVQLTDIETGRSPRSFTMYRNSDGSWRRENSTLQPGTYKATVNSQWGSGPELDEQEWKLVSGSNSKRISLPELHTLKLDGSTFQLRGGLNVQQKSSNRSFRVSFDNTHHALLTLLPPGQYTLTFRDRTNPREECKFDFTVPSGGTLTVTK